jgi:hypothetical protein
MTKTIFVARDFSETPGGRLRKGGPHSGEEFREKILEPAFLALSEGDKLLIDFDGGFGYPISFLEEAFGGLARKHGAEKVAKSLIFKSDEQPAVITRVQGYIRDAGVHSK